MTLPLLAAPSSTLGRPRDPGGLARAGRMSPLESQLSGRLCICVGAGGVGKTTMAASIALGRAAAGERVAVITIDPAPRLARALGFDALEGEPRRVAAPGELWAMRLDPKRTLDDLIASLAPDASTRDRALSNRIYRELSGAVAGSQEFSAVAKLYELDRDGSFDAIVLDTPPSRNALDFLDAPGRLMRFFDGRAIRMLLAQGGLATRVAGRASSPLLAVLSRLTGGEVLREISAFVTAIASMIDGLHARASAVSALLRDPATDFVLVSSPRHEVGRGVDRLRGGARARRAAAARARRQPRPRRRGGRRARWRRSARSATAAGGAGGGERRGARRARGGRPRADRPPGPGLRRTRAGRGGGARRRGPRARRAAARGRAARLQRLVGERGVALGDAVVLEATRSNAALRRGGRGWATRRTRTSPPGSGSPAPRGWRRRARRAPPADARRSRRAAARADGARPRRRARRHPPRRGPRRSPTARGRWRARCARSPRCARSVAHSAASRPASRPLRAPSGSSRARSASRWSLNPCSGSLARSRARSARAPRRARRPRGAAARRRRRTHAAPPPGRRRMHPAVVPPPSRDGQGPPRRALTADPGQRGKRHAGGVEAHGGLEVTQAAEHAVEPVGSHRRHERDARSPGPPRRATTDRAAARSAARAAPAACSRRPRSPETRSRGRAAAPSTTSSLALGVRRRPQLAVGRLEAVGPSSNSPPQPSSTRCRKQRSASRAGGRRRAAARRRCRGTRRRSPSARAPPGPGRGAGSAREPPSGTRCSRATSGS